MMPVEFGSSSNVGRVREHNEDAFEYLHFSRGDACIVCDGMGGHAAGDVASNIARATIAAALVKDGYPDPRELIYRALEAAHEKVLSVASGSDARSGMGTTAVVALLRADALFVGHVGDSRAYLVRDGLTSQLTRDQTRVQAMVDGGLLTEEAAKSHPDAGVLVQAIGQPRGLMPFVTPEPAGIPIRAGDVVVLCTDGVYDALANQEFATLTACRTAERAAESLVTVAVERDGQDNATAVVAILRAEASGRAEMATVEDFAPLKAGVGWTEGAAAVGGPRRHAVLWALAALLVLLGVAAAFLAGRATGSGSVAPGASTQPGPSADSLGPRSSP
jgi:protein phosphatase